MHRASPSSYYRLVTRAPRRDRLDTREHGKKDSRETARNERWREEEKEKSLFCGAAREPKSAPPFFGGSAREERRPRRGGPFASWAEGRGPDEENEEDERPERGTDRSARERNPRLPWLPSHSRLASLPWRRRHPVPLVLLIAPLASSLLCEHADSLTRTRKIPSSSLPRAPIFSPRRRTALALSRSLARSVRPSFLRGGGNTTERGKSKERNTRRRQPADACAILGPPRRRRRGLAMPSPGIVRSLIKRERVTLAAS